MEEPPPMTRADELLARLEPKVRTIIEDGCVKLVRRDSKHVYEFKLSRIRTKAAILQWAHHLCGKNWMDCDSLGVFIETVARHQKLDIHKPPY